GRHKGSRRNRNRELSPWLIWLDGPGMRPGSPPSPGGSLRSKDATTIQIIEIKQRVLSESESVVLPLNYSPTGLGRLSSLPDGALTWAKSANFTSANAECGALDDPRQTGRLGRVATVRIATRLKAATIRKTRRGFP